MNLLKFIAAAKKAVLLSVIALLTLSAAVAQDIKKVSFMSRNVTVREALSAIKRQTGYVFAVNHTNLDSDREITLSARKLSVDEVLAQALAGTGHEYFISDSHVLIYPAKPKPEPVAATVTTPANPEINLEKEIKAYTALHPERAAAPEPTVKYDTIVRVVPADPKGTYSYPSVSKSALATGETSGNLDYTMATPPRFSIKTNLLYGAAALALNGSVEIGLGNKTSVDLFFSQNPWNLDGDKDDNKKLVHWIVKPEFRYWLCERFNGHFFGAHPFYWRFNVAGYDIPLLFDKEYRNDGHAWGFGLSYGYHWMWSKHWGMEFNAGVGVAHMTYAKYDCPKCSDKIGDFKKTYFGPTSLGIKLVFVIK